MQSGNEENGRECILIYISFLYYRWYTIYDYTSRAGYLIRNFRSASDMTQKELMENCFMNLFCLNGYNGENSAFLGSLIFTS